MTMRHSARKACSRSRRACSLTAMSDDASTDTELAAHPMRVIDMHAFASDPRWDARVGNPVTGQAMVATDEAAHRAATLAAMHRANVAKAMVSGDHAAVLRWKQAAPDQVIVGYLFGDPSQVDVDFLRQEHAEGRL